MLDIDKLAADLHWLTDFFIVLTGVTVIVGILAIRNAIEINRHKRGD